MSRFAAEKKKKAQGQRGKYAEGEVQEYLDELSSAVAEFDWNRQYDARSARGGFPPQAGDFQYFRLINSNLRSEFAVNGLIEVKETEHPNRLPQKNFEKEKIGRLRKRSLAGTEIVILVYHTTTKLWRRPCAFHFFDAPAAPSWNLAELSPTTYSSLEEALLQHPSLTRAA